jgi:Helix-turn-helix domain
LASVTDKAGISDAPGPPGGGARPRSDPQGLALRALAHPLRWKLIDLLSSEGTATATRCAEVLGESVPSCAYHLGILAKYGYIELVPDRAGREKPWRMRSYHQDLTADGLNVEGKLAAEAATEAFLDHELVRMKDRVRRLELESAPWREASGLIGSSVWVTASELRELKGELMRIALRYADRSGDPDRRPEGAREARVFASTSVAPEPVPPTGAG